MKQIRTVVIGIGNMGKYHVSVYSKISHLIAVVDINEIEGRKMATIYGVKHYKDIDECIAKENIQAASVVVPTQFHKEVAIKLIRKRIPILIEKPLSDNLNDARHIINEAKKFNIPMMVGHIERFNPCIIKAKELINSGGIGRIISLLAIRIGMNMPLYSRADVGKELAIHDVDVFNYLLNEYPTRSKIVRLSVFKQNIADCANIILEYKSTVGMIQTNWITPSKTRRLYITGSMGFLDVDYIKQNIYLYTKPIKAKVGNDNFSAFMSMQQSSKKRIPVIKAEPLKLELISFLNMVKQNKVIDLTYALSALKLVM